MYTTKRSVKSKLKKEPTRYEMIRYYVIRKLAGRHPRWDMETLLGVASLVTAFYYPISFPYGAFKKWQMKRKMKGL